jgi:hypothetical protein
MKSAKQLQFGHQPAITDQYRHALAGQAYANDRARSAHHRAASHKYVRDLVSIGNAKPEADIPIVVVAPMAIRFHLPRLGTSPS